MTARVGTLLFIPMGFLGLILAGSNRTPQLEHNKGLRITSIVCMSMAMVGMAMALGVMAYWRHKDKMSFRVAFYLSIGALVLMVLGSITIFSQIK